ncbi:hypothetical protein Hoch_1329 [Haliangium ochraceum DSM 14365]|uniref:Uncharacterized protein n=1 Tax=Haliangium ochraceum (strain DSM 14365 / JCM 11303 / SMP-2) TaxID=502025 RepID=D0LTJ1_HALO1|nr:hypothetical protein Hoch_1329 [Haliangium ochraceum DSM 14365]
MSVRVQHLRCLGEGCDIGRALRIVVQGPVPTSAKAQVSRHEGEPESIRATNRHDQSNYV